MKITPYTTKSGLQIGCRYEEPRKPWEPTRTESMLQSALLDGQPTLDLDGVLIILGVAALMAVPYLIMAALA